MASIEIHHLTKRFGRTLAVDDLSFSVEAGTVTGFLGRNGAGKTTTLRSLLGLVTPNAGKATLQGRAYRDLPHPTNIVGAVLEATGFHPGRRARDHLATIAAAAHIPRRRVETVLESVGLGDAAGRRVGGFSLGMRQRLGLAAALLGDPEILILDEPTNGLDPDGIRWLRQFVQQFSTAGGTVLVSSHLLAEIAQTVDHVVIVERGHCVTNAPIAEITAGAARGVRIRTPMVEALAAALARTGLASRIDGADAVTVEADLEMVGRLIAASGIVVYEMQRIAPDLESAFFTLTQPQEHKS
jgi:ABC-2 type transport system ATP-binding protein